MPPPDAPGPTISTYAPDEETRAAAEVLKMLHKQQPTASLPKGSGLLTPTGEANHFKGGGLMRTVQQSDEAENVQHICLPTIYTSNTSRFNLYYNCGDPSPSQNVGRGPDKSHPERGITQLTPDDFKGCWQTEYK